MSDHVPASASESHEHDAHHHAPSALPEPTSPMWLPLVGIALFIGAGVLWLVSKPFGPPAPAAASAVTAPPH